MFIISSKKEKPLYPLCSFPTCVLVPSLTFSFVIHVLFIVFDRSDVFIVYIVPLVLLITNEYSYTIYSQLNLSGSALHIRREAQDSTTLDKTHLLQLSRASKPL